MMFNVEDIIALPQIKEGRMRKNVSNFSISKAVAEIKSI